MPTAIIKFLFSLLPCFLLSEAIVYDSLDLGYVQVHMLRVKPSEGAYMEIVKCPSLERTGMR